MGSNGSPGQAYRPQIHHCGVRGDSRNRRILVRIGGWLPNGQAVNPDLTRGNYNTVADVQGVDGFNEGLTIHLGAEDMLLNFGPNFENRILVDQLVHLMTKFKHRIRGDYPVVSQISNEAQCLVDHQPPQVETAKSFQ